LLELLEEKVALEEVGEEGVAVMVAILEAEEEEGEQVFSGLEVEVEMLGYQKKVERLLWN
jgi:hypothetical protein